MTITAKVIADSVGQKTGVRVTTLQLLYPRFIHSEFMTHRVFSRNASSSRAIPVAKIIEAILNDPAMPVSWGQNQKGMQADQEVDPATALRAREVWLEGAQASVETAERLIELGIHKQIANRVLEPWAHISVIVTATEWTNFFDLRDHKDAQPEIAVLAREIREAMAASEPRKLEYGEWHLPYVGIDDISGCKIYAELQWVNNVGAVREQYPTVEMLTEHMILSVSAARCARVSYNTHDGSRPLIEADISLADRLSTSKHMSPFEHQVTPCDCGSFHQNMRGWHTFRSIAEHTEKLRAQAAMVYRQVGGAMGKVSTQ